MQLNLSGGSGKGIIGKLVITGFGLFFAFIGTLFVKQEWNRLHEAKAMQEWIRTDCTITQSEVEDYGEDFRLVLSYEYSAENQLRTGDRYGLSSHYTAETIGDITQTQKRFAEGTVTDCYYDAADPDRSVLVLPTVKSTLTSIGLSLLFPAFGLFFASLPWLSRRKKKPTASGVEPARSPKKFLILFGLIFAAAGGLMLKPLFITPLQKTRDAQNWMTAQATVISSKVKSHSDDDGTTYSVYIAYRYEIDGEEYVDDTYTFMGGSSSGYESKANIVRRYPEGHEFHVFVNPADHSESVILRDYSLSLLFGLIPLAFMVIGIVIAYIGIRNKQPSLDMAQSQEHIVTLKYASPAKKAIGLSIFTLFWLAVVYFLARSDAPLLFPIIFGFFGLLLVFGSVQATLKIYTPRPTVEITPGNMHPGTTAAIRWRISGRTDRIEQLTVTLRCLKVETQTRRSGGETRTSVVKSPLFEEELLKAENQFEIVQGSMQFTIPEDQPPSRPGNHDGIQWQLAYTGTISRWPDMECEMPFTVYPQG